MFAQNPGSESREKPLEDCRCRVACLNSLLASLTAPCPARAKAKSTRCATPEEKVLKKFNAEGRAPFPEKRISSNRAWRPRAGTRQARNFSSARTGPRCVQEIHCEHTGRLSMKSADLLLREDSLLVERSGREKIGASKRKVAL